MAYCLCFLSSYIWSYISLEFRSVLATIGKLNFFPRFPGRVALACKRRGVSSFIAARFPAVFA